MSSQNRNIWMVYRTYELEDPRYFDILGRYFDTNGWEDTGSFRLEIREKHYGWGDIDIYTDQEKGRTLVLTRTGFSDYDEILLFSPLGTLEEMNVNSPFEPDYLETITEYVVTRALEFRKRLIHDLYRSRRSFNMRFRTNLNINFDFFPDCESIVEIDPLCGDENAFTNLNIRLNKAISKFDKKSTQEYLGEKEVCGSVDALRKIFERIGKAERVTEVIDNLRLIIRLRHNEPVHDTDVPLLEFLRKFRMTYPTKREDWCDLSILVMKETSEALLNLSRAL